MMKFNNPQFRPRLVRSLAAAFILCAIAIAWEWVPWLNHWEQLSLDFRYRHFNRETRVSEQIVVVDIDEQSFKLLGPSIGRWPWPRRIYKDLIEFLSLGQPAAILFDVLFTEAQQGTDDDAQLAEISANVAGVSHAMQLLQHSAEEREGIAPLPTGFRDKFGIRTESAMPHWGQLRHYQDFELPAPPYLAKSNHIHVVSAEKDADGMFRRMIPAFFYGESPLPSLLLQGLRLARPPGSTGITVTGNQIQFHSEQKPPIQIPLEPDGTVRLHYYNVDREAETVSFANVIDSAIKLQKGEVADPSELKFNPLTLSGKIILIGASATGAADLKSTPIHSSIPGVFLHATAISNALTQDYLKRVSFILRFLVLLPLIAASYIAVFFLSSIIIKTLLPVLSLGFYLAISFYLFRFYSLWLDVALPVFVSLASALDAFVYLSFVEGRERRKLKGALSKYLSPNVMESLIASGSDPRAEVGARRELSILFSDIRGFTTFSERFKPEFVVEILNRYLGRMTDVIFENKGTLDKFIGDAILAFWNAPLEDPNHVKSAVQAAFQMKKALAELRAEWNAKGIPADLEVGLGINTGEVIVGNIGSEKRLDYTVIGDNVNLASRLEGLTKQYQVPLIIGQRTRELLGADFACRTVDIVRVKGKSNHVTIYEPLEDFPDWLDPFEKAWKLYQARDFKAASETMSQVSALRPGGDPLSLIYVERCTEFLVSPPSAEWDGVYSALSK